MSASAEKQGSVWLPFPRNIYIYIYMYMIVYKHSFSFPFKVYICHKLCQTMYNYIVYLGFILIICRYWVYLLICWFTEFMCSVKNKDIQMLLVFWFTFKAVSFLDSACPKTREITSLQMYCIISITVSGWRLGGG